MIEVEQLLSPCCNSNFDQSSVPNPYKFATREHFTSFLLKMSCGLSTKDLEYIFHYEENFSKKKCCVSPMDKLPTYVDGESLYIINSDMHFDPGKHWISIYFPKDSHAEFFDSFGKCPSYYSHFLIDFLIENSPQGFIYNYKGIQYPPSPNCGLYCIYFLWERIHGITFNKFITKFSRDLKENDILVQNFFSQHIIKQLKYT